MNSNRITNLLELRSRRREETQNSEGEAWAQNNRRDAFHRVPIFISQRVTDAVERVPTVPWQVAGCMGGHGGSLTRLAAIMILCVVAFNCFAGKAQKWNELPETVRATILANGGKADGRVDKESEKIDGKVIYEAVGKDKSGQEVDLVVNEDGKLVMTKDDDAPDRAKEEASRAKQVLANV